jgi:hypothetical protein
MGASLNCSETNKRNQLEIRERKKTAGETDLNDDTGFRGPQKIYI